MIKANRASRIKFFAKIIMRVGFLAWVSFLCLYLYYGFSRPTSKQPEVGRLYSLDTHGHIAYLTRGEVTNLHHLEEAAIVLVLVAVAMAAITKLLERRRPHNQLG